MAARVSLGEIVASLAVHRNQSGGEEIANAISHGSAALLSLVALPVLVVNATSRGLSAAEITGAAVFGVSLILAYLSSIHHTYIRASSGRVASVGEGFTW